MNQKHFKKLVLESLEHEKGGVEVYQTALECVMNDDLKKEWQEYLSQTKEHVLALEGVCKELGLDPNEETPGRKILQGLGKALVTAMEQALASGERDSAEVVASECVVLAETKDHLDWELLGKCADELKGDGAKELKAAYEKIEDQEDEHLYHTRGWCRELWFKGLGIKAVLPPPEETRGVKTEIGAARAKAEADRMRH